MSERSTPYREVFGDTGIAATYFARIHEQLGEDARDRDRFFTAAAVGELLREIVPESGEGAAQIALLTYHAYHYWRAEEPLWHVSEPELRRALAGEVGEWRLAPPASAGYVQLPRNRLWIEGPPAESVDGFFWSVPADGSVNALHLLLVLGMVANRAGFTVVELASGPLPAEGHWGDVPARDAGEDFANVLPGGEHMLGLRTAGEVLKLTSRIFHQLQDHGSVRDRAGAGGDLESP